MKKINHYILPVLFVMFCMVNAKAQDPTFSNFNLNQLYYNPAYTGYHHGYQLSGAYRTLWPNVRGKVFPGPISTYHATFDGFLNFRNLAYAGVGAFAMQDIEGEGHLKTSSFGVMYSQIISKFSKKKVTNPAFQISLGVRAYFNTISIDWDNLVFTDQLNIDYGIQGSSAIDNSGITNKNYWDFDIGLLALNNFRGQNKWYNEVGFSMAHIIRPSIALSGSKNDAVTLPEKIVVSYRSSIATLSNKFFIGPTILFEKQKRFYTLNTGLNFYIKPKASMAVIPLNFSIMNRFWIRPGNVNTYAAILAFSHKGTFGSKSNIIYSLGFAVDLPYMGLGMQTAGAYELSLGLIFPQRGNNGFSTCPMGTFDHGRQVNDYYRPKRRK